LNQDFRWVLARQHQPPRDVLAEQIAKMRVGKCDFDGGVRPSSGAAMWNDPRQP